MPTETKRYRATRPLYRSPLKGGDIKKGGLWTGGQPPKWLIDKGWLVPVTPEKEGSVDS